MEKRIEYTCTECEWAASDGEREDASQLAIEHYVATGHPVERGDDADRRRKPLWSVRR